MEELYVIGNGFDIYHGLNTRYSNYKSFLAAISKNSVSDADKFLEELSNFKDIDFTIAPSDIKNWSQLEEYTDYFKYIGIDTLIDRYRKDLADNFSINGLLRYLKKYLDWILRLKENIDKWICSIDCNYALNNDLLGINKNAKFLNFNYTNTLENIYGVPKCNILHIHGSVDEKRFVFGNNDYRPKMVNDLYQSNYFGDVQDYTHRVVNCINSFYKNTNQILNDNIRFFNEVCQECRSITFMGFSFGEADSDYYNLMLLNASHLEKIIVYYYSESDKARANEVLSKFGRDKITEYRTWPKMPEKTINEVEYYQAKSYFLQSKSYFSSDLPAYFDFSSILRECSKKLSNHLLSDYNDENKAAMKDIETPNCRLNFNKDGKYQYRTFDLINPLVYVDLVNYITDEYNWNKLINRYNSLISYTNGKIKCCSMPKFKPDNNTGDAIKKWWSLFEQEVVYKSLEYKFMGISDISNCYSSIYTHTLVWAIEGKDIAKQTMRNKSLKNLLGNVIDRKISDMQNGQTSGIPQGSTLMDFLAEILLAYSDKMLVKKLDDDGIEGYYILRYRDDYRIFANDKFTVDKIIVYLSSVLGDLTLKLNGSKTMVTSDILMNSIKNDKIELLSRKEYDEDISLEKNLFYICNFGKKYGNSGSIQKLITIIYDEVIELKRSNKLQSAKQNIAILAEIMHDSPRTYSFATAVISILMNYEKLDIKETIDLILKKFSDVPSIDDLELYLQRLTIKLDRTIDYSCNLCKYVADGSNDLSLIWNFDWTKLKLRSSIINEYKLDLMDDVVQRSELNFVFETYPF